MFKHDSVSSTSERVWALFLRPVLFPLDQSVGGTVQKKPQRWHAVLQLCSLYGSVSFIKHIGAGHGVKAFCTF